MLSICWLARLDLELRLGQPADSSDHSLKCCNSASRRAREVPKKGKSSEFNPLNYEQVKSSPSLKVWSHKNVKDTVNLPKKIDLGAKKNIF